MITATAMIIVDDDDDNFLVMKLTLLFLTVISMSLVHILGKSNGLMMTIISWS